MMLTCGAGPVNSAGVPAVGPSAQQFKKRNLHNNMDRWGPNTNDIFMNAAGVINTAGENRMFHMLLSCFTCSLGFMQDGITSTISCQYGILSPIASLESFPLSDNSYGEGKLQFASELIQAMVCLSSRPALQWCCNDAVCPAVGLIHYSDSFSLRLFTTTAAGRVNTTWEGWMDGFSFFFYDERATDRDSRPFSPSELRLVSPQLRQSS